MATSTCLVCAPVWAQDGFQLRGTTGELSGVADGANANGASEEEPDNGLSFTPANTDLDAQRASLGMQDAESVDELVADERVPLAEQFDDLTELTITGSIGRAEAIGPLQTGVGVPLDAPYSAPGIQLGSILLRPSVEIGANFTSRTTRDEAGGPPAQIVRSTDLTRDIEVLAGVAFDGDFGQTQLSGEGNVTIPYSGDDSEFDSLTADANATLVRELAGQQLLVVTGAFSFDSEEPLSAAVTSATDEASDPFVLEDPSTLTLSGTIGYQRPVGPVVAGITLGAARTLLGDVSLSDGSEISQTDLNSTSYTAQLRGALDTGAILSPFVELDLGLRRFDESTDVNGLDRNSSEIALRGGVEFDLGDKLSGQIGAGYFYEDIQDDSLADLSGLSLIGELNWSPRRDIDVGVALTTETRPTGDVSSSGSIVYAIDSSIEYQARANLTLNGAFGVEIEDELNDQDDTTTINGQVGATYWYNRFVGITGRLGYEQTLSNTETNRSEEWSAFVGLRMQR